MRKIYFNTSYGSNEFDFDELDFYNWLNKKSTLIQGHDIDEEVYDILHDYLSDKYDTLLWRDGEEIEEIELYNKESFNNNIKVIAEAKDIDEYHNTINLLIQTIKYNL